MAIKHAGYWKPKVFPVNGDVTPAEIDRLQEFRGAPTLPVDQLYEIGRYAKMCSQKRPPEVAVSQRQYEYGNLEYYLKLANLSSGDKVELKDFDDAFVHFVGYEGLDENIFTSSILIPRGRLNGMTLSLAGPEDIIERTFDFTADTKIIWQNNNKYFIYNLKLSIYSKIKTFVTLWDIRNPLSNRQVVFKSDAKIWLPPSH